VFGKYLEKILFTLILTYILVITIPGCNSRHAPDPGPQPTATETPLPATLLIDDFEDNNLINNINFNGNDTWPCFGQVDLISTCHRLIDNAGGAVYGSYALKTTITVVASNNSGTYWWLEKGNAWTDTHTNWTTLAPDKNGLNLTGHNNISFAVSVNVLPKPVSGTLIFSVKLGREIMTAPSTYVGYQPKQTYIPADQNGTWGIVTIPLSTFAPDMDIAQADVSLIVWNVLYESPVQNDAISIDFMLDDVKFTQ
jgi:hypothetical protein